jgi:hypothetical protein
MAERTSRRGQMSSEERPHQGLGNELIAPKTTSIGAGPVMCRARLGGVLKFYYREARTRWTTTVRSSRGRICVTC